MSEAAILRLRMILLKGRVLVENKGGLNKREAIWSCLTSPSFPEIVKETDDNDIRELEKPGNHEKKAKAPDDTGLNSAAKHPKFARNNTDNDNEHNRNPNKSQGSGNANGSAKSALMKAYSGRPLFAGNYGDNITEAIELYETCVWFANSPMKTS